MPRSTLISKIVADALQEGQYLAYQGMRDHVAEPEFEKEPEVHADLLACENAVVIPHLGSASYETRIAMGQLATDNLEAVLLKNQPGPHTEKALAALQRAFRREWSPGEPMAKSAMPSPLMSPMLAMSFDCAVNAEFRLVTPCTVV